MSAWLGQYSLTGGHLSWGDQCRAPPILVDAFVVLREVELQAAQHHAEEEARKTESSLGSGWKR